MAMAVRPARKKAQVPISSKEDGSVMRSSAAQPQKAFFPMESKLSGRETSVTFSQPVKLLAPMAVIPLLTTIFLISARRLYQGASAGAERSCIAPLPETVSVPPSKVQVVAARAAIGRQWISSAANSNTAKACLIVFTALPPFDFFHFILFFAKCPVGRASTNFD